MLDANTSSGPDRERAGLEKETSEPPHGKLEKADPVSACTANIGDRLTVQGLLGVTAQKRCSDRPGKKHEKADHSACVAETQTGKEANMMVGRQCALENPFECLPPQPFPSYATNGTEIKDSDQAFLKSPLLRNHFPLDNHHRGTEVKDSDLFRSYFVYSNAYLGTLLGTRT
ncbi:hypothetical protein V8E54_006560 [Elaphomyces granulatus]